MIRTLSIAEGKALLDGAAPGSVDLVDVREPHEWRRGHLPGARLVPLEELKRDVRQKVKGEHVMFVCARGSRSQTAAQLAERAGIADIVSLDGGTLGWIDAGLPIVTEPDDAVEPAAVADDPPTQHITEAAIPALDAVVGKNLGALRAERGLSLDALAQMTGLSRTLLGQIENGRTAPSVSVVWKIAGAFGVPFATMLATSNHLETCVLRESSAKRLVSADGRFSSRALFPLGDDNRVEFYELWLAPRGREIAEPHAAGTQENLIVTAGRLELDIKGELYTLGKGDAIVFKADVPHSYTNPSNEECWMHLVMSYQR